MSKTDSPVYVLRLRAAPGSDGIRALRWLLKIMWRRYQVRCVSIEQEDGS